MTVKELLTGIETTKLSADFDIEIHGVSYDSRNVKTGDVFVAIDGYEKDGHMYIEEAAENGAVCIICEKEPSVSVPFILVEDSRKALAGISANWFGNPGRGMKIIGVTGTNGKTTVTSLIKEVLERCTGKKAGLIGTNRCMIGDEDLPAERTTPESYEIQKLLMQMKDRGCEYAVMEISSHALYLNRVYGLEFEVGIFTNLSQDHLDFHETIDEYARTKALLFKQSRNAAINIDDEYTGVMRESAKCPVLTYSIKDVNADLVAKSIKLHENRVDFCALTIGSIQRVELNIPGMFSIYNALSAISAMMLLGFDIGKVSEELQLCSGVKGRAEVVPGDRDYTILIDYAHTPDALENIIKTAKDFTNGRVITLFGCGGDRDPSKRAHMGSAASRLSDYVIVTSDNPRTEEPGEIIKDIVSGMVNTKTPYKVIENRREAIFWALEHAYTDDTLIFAGKGHETYQVLGSEQRHFDEREIIAEYFENKKKKKTKH